MKALVTTMLDDAEDCRGRSRQIKRDNRGMARADGRARMWELLHHLRPRQGAALLLLIGFQLPERIVAAVLKMPENSVNSLCTMGLRTLRARAGITGAGWR